MLPFVVGAILDDAMTPESRVVASKGLTRGGSGIAEVWGPDRLQLEPIDELVA